MAGQVDERTKKARAAALLVVAAEARSAFAGSRVGTEARVLVESRLPDGRWIGHAEDHVLVAVLPRAGDPDDLENAILNVYRSAVDGEAAERLAGDIRAISPAPRMLRPTVPVMDAAAAVTSASSANGGAHVR